MIDEYLQELAADERAALRPVVDQVRAPVPGAETDARARPQRDA